MMIPNEQVIQYDIDNEIPYPSVSGLDGGGNGVVSSYSVNSFPRFYLIDSTKTIIDQVDPPTLVVFDDRFSTHSIEPTDCDTADTISSIGALPESSGIIRVWPNPSSDVVHVASAP